MRLIKIFFANRNFNNFVLFRTSRFSFFHRWKLAECNLIFWKKFFNWINSFQSLKTTREQTFSFTFLKNNNKKQKYVLWKVVLLVTIVMVNTIKNKKSFTLVFLHPLKSTSLRLYSNIKSVHNFDMRIKNHG